MSTHQQRRAGRVTSGPSVRVSIDDLLKSGVSMLGETMTPAGYGAIETDKDAVDVAFKPTEDKRIVRVHIVWDNQVDNFPLEEALELMRGTGAAMVIKAEEVK